MIVPKNRMILWVTAVLFPSIIVERFFLPSSVIPAFFVLLLFFAITGDIFISFMRRTSFTVALLPVHRMVKGEPGEITLTVFHEESSKKAVRLGLVFPGEFITNIPVKTVSFDPRGKTNLLWPCVPRERGTFFFTTCVIEEASSLGFWAIRGELPVKGEVKVYPPIKKEMKTRAAAFFMKKNFGMNTQRLVGKGKDFEKLREYIPGDAYDDIHWKATAKRRYPVTKVFQRECKQEVYLVIDASRLSARAIDNVTQTGVNKTILDQFILSSLLTGLAAQKLNDRFGILTFSNTIHHFMRADNGKAHQTACLGALFNLMPQMVTPDYENLFTFIRMKLRRRAFIIFLTNLDDPLLSVGFLTYAKIVCRQHLVMVSMISRPGVGELFLSDDVNSPDDIYNKLGGHICINNLFELKNRLKQLGIPFSLMEYKQMTMQIISQYIDYKQRQIL